jgi:phage N-6-adenine-methyltransferase
VPRLNRKPPLVGRFASNDLRYRDGDHPQQTQFTPAYVLEPVRAALGGHIALDPCTTADNPCGADGYYFLPTNGLTQPWDASTIYVNPPYGKAREPWVGKCVDAACVHGAHVVLLIPAATDTRIFQYALETADEIVFIRGRVKFGVLRPNRRQVAASHPSALLGWNVSLKPCDHLGMRVRVV